MDPLLDAAAKMVNMIDRHLRSLQKAVFQRMVLIRAAASFNHFLDASAFYVQGKRSRLHRL
jgi:hypothetical protein